MIAVLISLGSNIEPEDMIPAAFTTLAEHPDLRVLRRSSIYRSTAVGGPDGQPEFHNAAVLAETELAPGELREALRGIEADMGRTRSDDKFAPRTIDLDIALYGGEIVADPIIPDPDLLVRPHVLVPVAEIAAQWEHPGVHRTLGELAADMHVTEEELRIVTRTTHELATTGHYATDLEADTPDEVYDPEFESLVTDILLRIREDPNREGLRRTPLRVAKAFDFLTSGYTKTVEEVVNDAVFEHTGEEMVVVRDIEFYSLCEHHLMPFFGSAHVAYLPKGKIIGLSKIARIVDVFARRLQVQERLVNQIADSLMEVLEPHGVAVVIEASHFCMMMRGVQKQNSAMVTSAMRGTMLTDPRTRTEFLELIRR